MSPILPEMIEVETYRLTAERVVGRQIVALDAHDSWYLKNGTSAALLDSALIGATALTVRRIGKLLLIDVGATKESAGTATLGLRFGMTGRLIVDGVCDVGDLLYSSHKQDTKFVRFAVKFDDGGTLEISDPRRLGGVELDPDVSKLGIDALGVSVAELGCLLSKSNTTLKVRLLDQGHISGIGNLIADEALWQAGLAPNRPSASLSEREVSLLHRVLNTTIRELARRGGSHMGDLMISRERGSLCPRCQHVLSRDTVGGRTTYWCPAEQL